MTYRLRISETARQELRHHHATVDQADRISGINPADISILLIQLERQREARG